MRLKQIVKFIQFLLLLFVFACGGNNCSWYGDKSKFTGMPQMPHDAPEWVNHIPKKLASKSFDTLFGASNKPDQNKPDQIKGLIGMRKMSDNSTNNINKASSPETIDLSSDKDKGTVYGMYSGIIRSTEYRATYYLCLILFVVLLGLSYILGMTEMSLQKAIPIMVKVGIISLFTNPALSNSTGLPIGWTAYYNVIVSPSIYAMEAFAMHFAAALFEINIDQVDSGFAPLSIMLEFMFNSTFWIKMTMVVFGAMPMGAATFIVMMLAMITYILAAVLAIMSYFTIILTLGVLFAIGPVFFIFLLFEKTKKYFEQWWKQILALMFQQYTLFISISIFGFIMIKCVQSMLSFDVYCKSIINIKLDLRVLPVVNIPIFKYYAPSLGNSESLTMMMYAIFLFMLAAIFATSIEKISQLSNGLIDGVNGIGTEMGLVNKGFDWAKGKLGEYSQNFTGHIAAAPEKIFKTGFNLKDAIKTANAEGKNGFRAGVSSLVNDLNPIGIKGGLRLKPFANKDKVSSAAERIKQMQEAYKGTQKKDPEETKTDVTKDQPKKDAGDQTKKDTEKKTAAPSAAGAAGAVTDAAAPIAEQSKPLTNQEAYDQYRGGIVSAVSDDFNGIQISNSTLFNKSDGTSVSIAELMTTDDYKTNNLFDLKKVIQSGQFASFTITDHIGSMTQTLTTSSDGLAQTLGARNTTAANALQELASNNPNAMYK